MDKTTYRQELQQVRYTDAGRAALVEQLMADQAAERPVPKKRWGRKGFMAILAAVLLVTAAAAVTVSLWTGYFGGLDKQQQAVVDTMETPESGMPPAAETDGVTITPLNILGSKNQLYIVLEVRAPEGTVFTEEGSYWLVAGVKPKVKPTEMVGYGGNFTVLEAGTREPNVLTCVDEISASCDLGGGTYQVRGLKDGTTGEWIFEGQWVIQLPEDLTGNQVLEPEAAGVTVETEQGTFTLDTISVSPLGIFWQFRFDGENEPIIHAALKIKDGSRVEAGPRQLVMGAQGALQTATASFEKPVDLSQAVAVYWGNVEIPLDGQGEVAAAEDVPVISDEPPFAGPSAGVEENGNEAGDAEVSEFSTKQAASSEEKLGVWKREFQSGDVIYSVSGGSAASYSQTPAWRPTWLPEGWSMDYIGRVSGPENAGVQITYQNGTEMLDFDCVRPVERRYMTTVGSDGRLSAKVQGRDADFYKLGDFNELFWTDDAGNLFKLSGELDQAVMERIANSVAEVSQEAMPQYQLGWAPEGYANTSRTTNIPGVVWETWRDAGVLTFEWRCVRDAVLTVPDGTPEAVTVNGAPAQFWTGNPNGGFDIDRDGVMTHIYTNDQKNVLCWTDLEIGLMFRIRGMMDRDDMIRMAGSLTVGK